MPKRHIIEGKPALIVIDIQENDFVKDPATSAIPAMPGYLERITKTKALIEAARAAGVPVIFVKEVHRPDLVDFGRELDGSEDVHCIESDPLTDYAKAMEPQPTDYFIAKRRYSCFFGTDLEILLKGLKAETLILTGALTDVCVHYTFVDGHQRDYYCRVVEDCVAGSSRRAQDGALEAMEYLQTGARRSLEEMLAAFRDRAGQANSSAAE
ncbi:MAG: cysteine hydrolase [Pseudomonadota bacterium]